MTKNNTPALRFEGFVDEWNESSLGEHGTPISGVGFPHSEQGGSEGTPFFKVSDMERPGNRRELRSAANYVSAEQIKKGGWPVNRGPWSIAFAKVGAAVLSDRKRLINGSFLTDNNMMAFVLSQSTLTPDFTLNLFETLSLSSLVQVGALPSINSSQVKEVVVYLPPTPEEQRAIGKLFSNLDTLIEQHRAKHTNLQQTKTALLQRMFPHNGADEPELRLGGFSGAWEIAEFGSVITRSSTSSKDPLLPRLEYEDIVSEVGVLNKDLSAKGSLKEGLLFGPGDVLYGKLRPYLKNWLLPEFAGIAVGDFWVLQSLSVVPEFLYQLIQTPMFAAVTSISSGSKMPRADWNLVSRSLVAFPPTLEEQRAIGEVFASLDALIAAEQRYITQLTQAKTALLQRMFV